ncbi:hypothetical protein AURDEDRAFT_132001 [Auricularia subglabra TFB-10046 SS5]|uniref:F-box domain-containing protein n=1 Tax=Auricularia subglabra (strain TFB-10046 / SS5) TaxID=717982 RepID=J0WKE6_AURST|nr:hypothetical protein AURDEDRAFT_132001 [Auricularia subglabra TFB-10046 SS5]
MPVEPPMTVALGIEEIMPVELVARCLDFLDLDDILRIMSVNKRWTDVARDHPTYWRDLALDYIQSREPHHVQLFRLRLSRSRGRPVKISLQYFPDEPGERDILPDLSHHLDHIQVLDYTTYDDEMVDAVLEALAYPAPILRDLKLSMNTVGPNREVRADFLAGSAPLLRSALFGSLDLPIPIPACLRDIERLTVLSAAISDIFQSCQRLRELHLYHAVTLHPAFLDKRSWNNIQVLCIDSGEIARTWHSIGLPVSQVPKLVVRMVYTSMLGPPETEASLSALSTHMAGGIGVHVSQTFPGLLWIDLRGTSEHTLHLNHSAMLVDREPPNSEFKIPYPGNDLAAGFCDRVLYLSVALEIWEFALCLGDLPVMENLVLLIKDGGTPENLGLLSCPRLKRLILRKSGTTSDPIAVALAPFAEFARSALPDAPFPLLLQLEHVELLRDQDIERESATFRSMSSLQPRGDHRWL